MNAIYFDMMDVKEEIRSFVNIERFGDLHYKKMTLSDHSKKIFSDNNISEFNRITNKKELSDLVTKIQYAGTDTFLLVSSNLAIIDREAFKLFLKKISFIENSLVICGGECKKPLLKMTKKETLEFLSQILNEDKDLYEVLDQKGEEYEKFGQEKFYHEIRTYPDFVTYLQSNFELRYFNSIQSTRNIITKRSVQKEKMLKEYSYYSVLPDEMKIFFLPTFNFKEHEEYAEYSLERLQILDFSVQWIHLSVVEDEFKRFLKRLFDFILSRKQKNVSGEKLKSIRDNLYLQKLDNRLQSLKETKVFKYIEDIIRNGTEYESLDEVIDKYKRLYAQWSTNDSLKHIPTISHGDLCFSNILYDKRIDFIKFIDPKGCIDENEAYMDAFYDIAKLSHSILGNYDFINSGIFEIKYDNHLQVSLEIPHQDILQKHHELFKTYLKEHQFSYKQVRLFEASLFLSMLPLHIDYPKKVLAFILTAIKILDELENERSNKSRK